MRAILTRIEDNKVQTIGILQVFDDRYKLLFTCRTLELPWRENQRRISCIPPGTYECIEHKSPRFGDTVWVQNVKDRSEILIHQGNYHTQTLGCILVGNDFTDINKDGQLDITNSRVTMNQLLAVVPKNFTLTIVNGF